MMNNIHVLEGVAKKNIFSCLPFLQIIIETDISNDSLFYLIQETQVSL